MKNLLLTGSGGFIGSHLLNWLNEYNLFHPRSKDLNLLDKDAVKNYIERNNIEIIIHSASNGVRIQADATLEEVAKPNLEMFYNLADTINDNRFMITIGSGAEYDKSNPIIEVKESSFGEYIPKDPYGYSKYLISKEIEKRNNILNLRLFGIYGYLEDPSRVTSCIINDKLCNKDIVLNQNVIFSFIYIDDFCKIVKFFVENRVKEKFINVASDQKIEIVELANIVNSFTDNRSLILVKKEGLNKEYSANIDLLKKLIPNFQFTSFNEGMFQLYKKINNSFGSKN